MPLNLKGIAIEKEEAEWKRVAHRLATEVLAPNAARTDQEGRFPREGIRALGEARLMGLTVHKDKGGPGGNIKTAALVIEELAQGCPSTAMCYTMHMSTVPMIAALVEEVQVADILEPLIRGERLNSLAMSEPGSGNRLWHMDSYAQLDGDHYIVDSFKSFATSTGECDFYVVPVRANKDVGPNDLSLFVIDGKDPNIKTIGKWDGMGMRGNSSTPVHFDKVQVPASRRLGSETCGFSMLFSYSLPIYQVGLSAVYLGIAQAAYDTAVAHVKKRIHSDTGVSLAKVETVQRYIAEMKLRIDQTRFLIYRVAQMADNALVLFDELKEADLLDEVIRANPDDPFFIDVAQIKVSACEMVIDVASKALQVCGGTAYKRGHPAERFYRDARAGSVMAPSDDTLKLIMGRQILGIAQPWE
ncbi:MAG TPA: acyl-CoA dehydrogenase family protein [Pyrinomonadaceae bacterium]|nr:acyl-CoA dehydrogenase family protein [Pyrinomonadaceae bacterium]